MKDKILAAVKELREKSQKRNFPQTFDLIANLKEYDTKKPENKFTEDIVLPNGRGSEPKIIIFGESVKEKDVGCEVFDVAEIRKYAQNKKESKRLVATTDFFLSEPKLMPEATKALGQFLGTRGKIPKLLLGDAKKMVDNYKKSTRVRIKDSPVIQAIVGKENMKDEDVADNVEAVVNFLKTKMPKGMHNIRRLMIKLTMSKPVKIELEVKGKK